MEIDITFRDGPIDAKISATEEESYIDVLEEFSQFVEGYDPTGYQMQKSPQQSNRDQHSENSHEDLGLENESASAEIHSEDPLIDDVDATKSELSRWGILTGRRSKSSLKSLEIQTSLAIRFKTAC